MCSELQLVDEFRQAARNAIDAGFDGVEIHGANVSYLCMSLALSGLPTACTWESSIPC